LSFFHQSSAVDRYCIDVCQIHHLVDVRILPCFKEEMMVQEDPNKLKKKMIAWREEKKQIKES